MTKFPKIDTLCYFGSFDPPHYGHLSVVQTALDQLPSIKRLLIIPAYKKVPYKNLTDIKHRLRMTKMLFGNIDKRIVVLEMDVDEMLWGKTINPLKKIAKGEKNTIGILFGADAFLSLEKWKLIKEILEFAYLFIVPRAHLTSEDMKKDPFLKIYKNRILVLKHITNDFLNASSTKVKQQLKLKKHSSLTNKKVSDYINVNNLYLD